MVSVAERVVDHAMPQGRPDISVALAPLVVGVTGHRDLREEDGPRLKKAVQDALSKLCKGHEHTPLIVISPLAEGADRLVANVVLEMYPDTQLVVPLPLPLTMYEADFQEPGSLAEFRQLLGRAKYSFEIPPPDYHGGPIEGSARDRQYQEMGKYIARQSQIVIALWDGVDNGKTGGTAEIVKFQTQGIPDLTSCNLYPLELFPVYHIPTPRKSNSDIEWEPFEPRMKYPSGFENEKEAEDYYDRIFKNLHEFNRSICEGGAALVEQATRSRNDLIRSIDMPLLSPAEIAILNRYAVADGLAILFQQRLRRVHRALHWSVFSAFFFFVLFAHLPGLEHSVLLILGALLILGLGFWDYRQARRTSLDNRWLDYRTVAEGCRVGLFWQLNGVKDLISDNYLGQQRTDLDWVRNGLRGWDIIRTEDDRPASVSAAGSWMGLALRNWVEKQQVWFADKIHSEGEKLEQMEFQVESLLYTCLGVVAGVALIALIHTRFASKMFECVGCEWMVWFVIVIDLLLAGGALLHHANERMARAEHIKQYKRMHIIFQNASKTIERRLLANDIQGARDCLKELGRQALRENADWVLLHRERPLELPHP